MVLKRGVGAPRTAAEIAALPGVTVLDEVAGAGLLVEVETGVLGSHQEALLGWTIAPETEHPLPETGPPLPRSSDDT